MSGIENKENKQQTAKSPGKCGSLTKTASVTKMACLKMPVSQSKTVSTLGTKPPSLKKTRSCKRLRKKINSERNSFQLSEQPSEQVSNEIDTSNEKEDKEEKTISISGSRSVSNAAINISSDVLEPPVAPETHYLPVIVKIDSFIWLKFLDYVVVSRNMVIRKVGRCLMTELMPGDQLSSVDGTVLWNLEDLEREIFTPKQGKLEVTVIRAWNLKCPTNELLERVNPRLEERLHYFVATVYCKSGAGGLKICADRKRVLVQHIIANTPVSSSLLIGDQILGVNDELLSRKSKKTLKQQVWDMIKQSTKKQGYAEIFGCRLIGPRSSPAPSLEAEIAQKFADYAVGVEKGTKCVERKNETISLPLEADALEIAMRELTFLKQWIGDDKFELPPCDKGPSLFADSLPSTNGGLLLRRTNSDVRLQPANPMVNIASATIGNNGPPTIEKSVYMPATVTATLSTPDLVRNRSKRKKMDRDSLINLKEQPETSPITSDVPEEDELKKCDAKSGIVAYIRNYWNS